MSDPVLSAHGVAKAFPDGGGTRQVLSDVAIEVAAGMVVGLQGPSGCGKSTLLAILGGLLAYDRGRVVLAGAEVDYSRPRDVARLRREHVGLVSQTYGLLSTESVAANVTLPLMYDRPRPSLRERRAVLVRALEEVALDVDSRARVSTLSQGQQQRVAIARALVRQPTVLLADEPTAALDPVAAGRIVDRLRHLADEGVGVLVATHDQRVASACDVVHEFRDGRLLRVTEDVVARGGGV